jgi:hypothetical protein
MFAVMEVIRQQAWIGCGASSGPDAVFDAVDEAVHAVGGCASGVLVFAPAQHGGTAAAAQASNAANGARVAGMSSDGVIADRATSAGACAVAFHPRFQVGIGYGEDLAANAGEAGRRAVERALDTVDVGEGHPIVLLLVDTTVADLGEVVAGTYNAAGLDVPLAGGGANASVGDGASPPWLFADDEPLSDAVVAIAVVSPDPVAVAHAHGGRPHKTPALVTESQGRCLLELDGARAEDVYLELLGCGGLELSDSAFERLAVLHPLGQLELDGKLRLRHIHRRVNGSGLFCSGTIREGAAVVVVEETPAAVLSSARVAARDAEAALGRPARFALVFDGAARRRIVTGTVGADASVAALLGAFSGAPAVAGVYTRGEIGRARGPFGDLNHEIVVVAFA